MGPADTGGETAPRRTGYVSSLTRRSFPVPPNNMVLLALGALPHSGFPRFSFTAPPTAASDVRWLRKRGGRGRETAQGGLV